MANVELVSVISWIASGFMILGGVIPYVPQYAETWKTGITEGFSLYVCLTLLVGNILRILFWFGHPFELPLLIQSVVMIIAMFAMIHLCTVVKSQTIVPAQVRSFSDPENINSSETTVKETESVIKLHKLTDFESKYFWNWTYFSSYVQFILLFTSAATFLTYTLHNQPVFIEVQGFLALICEAMLGAPQFWRNMKNQSTRGMSVTMVFMWTVGDLFKTMYFIFKRTPLQFLVCGMVQVGLDLAILTQVLYYRDTAP